MTRHPHVPHPRDAVTVSQHWNDRLLGFVSDHVLASRVMFDIALIIPLIVLPMSTSVKVTLGVISGSWIQWWALPSLQRSANIADVKREAKADADHEALSHIATVSDRSADHLDLGTPGGLAVVMEEVRSARAEMLSEINGSRDDLRAVVASVMALLKTADPKDGGKPAPGRM